MSLEFCKTRPYTKKSRTTSLRAGMEAFDGMCSQFDIFAASDGQTDSEKCYANATLFYTTYLSVVTLVRSSSMTVSLVLELYCRLQTKM